MKKYLGGAIILFLIFLLSACNKSENDNEEAMKIYYINSKTSILGSVDYLPESRDKVALTKELINKLREQPENAIYRKTIPDNIKINELEFKDNSLTINFDQNYSVLEGIAEVLLRSAVVKTLLQIDDLEYIEFYVQGQPLMDINGVVGLMTIDDFIESTGAETDYKVTLYYANETGKALVESNTSVFYTGTGSIEEMVINQLINGSTEPGMYSTIPEGTTLLNISTKDGFCIVDFNEMFLNELPAIKGEVSISAEVTVYSVVNTLVELPGINKVQFLINGAPYEKFREDINLNEIFERNLSIIEGEK